MHTVELNLRFLLLGIGFIFVAAILIDGMRRRRARARFAFDYDSDPQLQADDEIDAVPDSTWGDHESTSSVGLNAAVDASDAPEPTMAEAQQPLTATPEPLDRLLVVYVLAEPGNGYVGYELLQTLLSAGLRFGEMNIFHRYQELNSKGRILFSLASATEPGIFDIQKMGSVSVSGLCLFMKLGRVSHPYRADLDVMLQTAYQIVDDLGGKVLDDNRQPFKKASYQEYVDVITQHHRQVFVAPHNEYA